MQLKTSLLELQKALFDRLSNDANVAAVTNGVFDDVPESTPYPYLTIGEATATNWDTKTFNGEEITITFHVWSNYKGKKECYEILDSVINSLSTPLIVSGFHFEASENEYIQVFLDDLGYKSDSKQLYHGVIRVRFKISQ